MGDSPKGNLSPNVITSRQDSQTVQRLLDWIRLNNENQLPEDVIRILKNSAEESNSNDNSIHGDNNIGTEEVSVDMSFGEADSDLYEALQCQYNYNFANLNEVQNTVLVDDESHLQPAQSTCAYCTNIFPSLIELSKHALTHCKLSLNRIQVPTSEHKIKRPRIGVKIYEHENMFHCGNCAKTFTSRGRGLTHWKRVHLEENELKIFKCPTCGKVLCSKATLRQHIRNVHTSGEHAGHLCSICGQEFRLEKYLKKHISYVHIREKSFQCTYCSAAFVNSHSLKAHVDRHLKTNEQQCPYCGILQSQNNIKSHIEFMHEGKRLKCNFCDELFSSAASVRTHFYVKHPDESDFSSVRQVVTPVKIDISSLNYENTNANPSTPSEIPSDLNCENFTASPQVQLDTDECVQRSLENPTEFLENDANIDFNSDPIPKRQCPMCSKFYTHLEAHQLTAHSSKAEFKCKFCDREFKSYSSLHSHVRWFHILRSGKLQVLRSKSKSKTINNRLACLLCNMSFGKRIPYKLHMRKHDKNPEYRAVPRKHVQRLNEPKKPIQPVQKKKSWQIKPPFSLLDCPYDSCALSFTGIQHLRFHLKRSHREFSGYAEKIGGNEDTCMNKKSPCPVCGKLIFWCNLKRHVLQVHRGMRAFHCSICNKSFHQKSALELHKTTNRHHEMQKQQIARENVIMIIETI